MKKLLILVAALNAGSVLAGSSIEFTPVQQEQIGKIAAQYLVEHPEFLIQASQKLQEQQLRAQKNDQKKAVIKNVDVLLNDPKTPFVGDKNAEYNLVEFFDYQCIYCAKMSESLEVLQKQHPNVKFIFKETPIFGSHWKASTYAAQVGLATFAQHGSVAYQQFHNAIFHTGLNEGKLTMSVIDAQAKSLHVDVTKIDEYYQNNMQLFSKLGFKGTPGFVVMPTHGATIDNTFVINGADIEALNEALAQN